MRHLNSFLCSLLLAGFLLSGSALGQQEPTYLLVSYAKATGDGNVAQIENEVWKPLFEAAVKDGLLQWWSTYAVWTGADNSYDFVYVQAYPSLDHMAGDSEKFAAAFARVHPDRDLNEEGSRASRARDIVRTEIWSVLDFVGDGHGRYMTAGFMKVPPGGRQAYVDMEREVARPLVEVFVEDGAQTGWGLMELLSPGGTERPYSFMTPNFYADLGSTAAAKGTDERIARAHPNADMAALSSRVNSTRDMVRVELWELVAHAH